MDTHIQLANKLFRDAGFSLTAMRYRRTPEALAALKRHNGLQPDAKVPFAWNYHPNEYCRDFWIKHGRLA